MRLRNQIQLLRKMLRIKEPIAEYYASEDELPAVLGTALENLTIDVSTLEAAIETDPRAAQDAEVPDDGSEDGITRHSNN